MSLKKSFMSVIFYFIILSLVASVTIPAKGNAAQRLTLGGGSAGGLYYLYSAAVSRLINKHFPDKYIANAVSSAGAAENAKLLQKQEEEFAPVQKDVAFNALHGMEEFKGKPCTDLMAVSGGYSYAISLIVDAESPVKSYKDLIGKNVATGTIGGSFHTQVLRILEAGYNIDPSQITQSYGNYNAQPEWLKDGSVDAIYNPHGVTPETRGGGTYNLTLVKKVRFISMEDGAIKKVLEKYPYFKVAEVEPGFFPNQNEKYKCLTVPVMFCTNKNVSEEIVYDVTKLIFEKKDELIEILPAAKDWLNTDDIQTLNIPLHPGALRFYKEKGIKMPKF